MNRSNPRRLLAACSAGLITALAFPWWGLWPFAWVGLIPLLWAIEGRSPREAALLGWFAGVVHFGMVLYWLLGTIRSYGGLPWVLALAVLFLLVIYLGAYWCVFCAAVAYVRNRLGIGVIWAAPPIWCGLEFMRGILLTGFPWASLGYSQWQLTPIMQITDLTGVAGVSFVLIWANCALFGLLTASQKAHRRISSDTAIGALLAVMMVAAGLLYGHWRIGQVTTHVNASPTVKVGVAQGNIDQFLKWDPAFQNQTLHIYESLTNGLSQKGAEVVVWPETAAPFFFQRKSELRARLFSLAEACDAEILFGSPAYGAEKGRTLFNRAYLIGPDRTVRGHYDKIHLVPFGEYVPLKTLLFFVHKMVEGIGEFSPGERVRVLPSETGASFGVMICFESIFPQISRTLVRHGADVLVNLTNDAWFGKTPGPYQHLSMLVPRAIENRRWIVRAANTGISALIDPCGRIHKRTQWFERTALVDTVSRVRINSVYCTHGERFSQACALWGVGLLIFSMGSAMGRREKHVAS